MFFQSIFPTTFLKAKKWKKIAQQETINLFLGRPGGMRGLLGREMGGVQKPFQIEDIGSRLDIAEFSQDLEVCIQHASSSLREGGGTLRAFRRAKLSDVFLVFLAAVVVDL